MDELRPRPANSYALTPVGFLDRAAIVYGDCPSIIYNNISYTWSQTHRRCLQLASSLSSIGLNNGHVVSILAPNIPAMYELHFAVPMAGAILNTLNTRLDARTISLLLCHAESELLFVDLMSVSLVNEAISLLPSSAKPPLLVLIADDDEVLPQQPSPTIHFHDTYEGLLEKGDPAFNWTRPKNDFDPIVLNYTSGTTSSPKGVVHCHRGLFIVTLDSLVNWSFPKQPVFLWTLPMFHSNGWSYPWGMAAVGGTNICLRKFDAPTIYGLIKKHGVTHMCGAPVVLNMLSNSPTNMEPLKNPVHIITAGAPPPATILSRTDGGENLSSVEVESVLYTFPDINEAAVVARPDEFWGETPCAFVSLKEACCRIPTEKEIIEHCRGRLPHYMVPKTVVVKEKLPKTSTGKIQKAVLRDMAKAMGSSRASRM
ncbi:hypothetical protein H0E87_009469 [Populus deltoides]|uniref:4-coumarate--CoA ligase n=1 Tax=Populus deltoides TaxID=3696 RepID=A0A8T2Z4H3_POPDE|nr:hypothetical protein H0E87_009469 [Populus deltoides]